MSMEGINFMPGHLSSVATFSPVKKDVADRWASRFNSGFVIAARLSATFERIRWWLKVGDDV